MVFGQTGELENLCGCAICKVKLSEQASGKASECSGDTGPIGRIGDPSSRWEHFAIRRHTSALDAIVGCFLLQSSLACWRGLR